MKTSMPMFDYSSFTTHPATLHTRISSLLNQSQFSLEKRQGNKQNIKGYSTQTGNTRRSLKGNMTGRGRQKRVLHLNMPMPTLIGAGLEPARRDTVKLMGVLFNEFAFRDFCLSIQACLSVQLFSMTAKMSN